MYFCASGLKLLFHAKVLSHKKNMEEQSINKHTELSLFCFSDVCEVSGRLVNNRPSL